MAVTSQFETTSSIDPSAEYTLTGTIPFTYLADTDISVQVGTAHSGAEATASTVTDFSSRTHTTHWTVVNNKIKFKANGLKAGGVTDVFYILVSRDTKIASPRTEFQAGSALTAAALNNNNTQLRYYAQEFDQKITDMGSTAFVTGDHDDINVVSSTSYLINDGKIDAAALATNAVTNVKILDDTIAESKLDIHNGPSTGKVLRYTSNGMEWGDESVTSPTNITLADESSDTTCFPTFSTSATGAQALKTGTNLTFNSANGTLTATAFAGNITGNVTGDVTGNVTGNVTGSILGSGSIASTITATTQSTSDSSTKIATTAYVKANVAGTTSEKPSGLKLGSFRPNTATLGLYSSDLHPSNIQDYGVGNSQTSNIAGVHQGNYISNNGKTYVWGLEDANSDGSSAKGHVDTSGHMPSPIQAQLRLPAYFMRALGGDSDEAKWLTDLSGASLGYTTLSQPKVINMYNARTVRYWLTENGMLFGAGNDTYSIQGNGNTGDNKYAAVPVQFYNTAGAALTGTNRPKIKMFTTSAAGDDVANATQYNNIAMDTDGNLYSWGHNDQGQLGRGFDDAGSGDTVRTKACQINFTFSGTPTYITSEGSAQSSTYCITSSGKLYAWGHNDRGQLGIGSTSDANSPTEVTAVASDLKTAVDAGAKVVHVYSIGSNTDYRRALVLTDAGKVYACGRNSGYGVYLGINTGSSFPSDTDITTFTEVSILTTAMNAAGTEKALSLWTTGGDTPTHYVITDGGSTTNYRVLSWGNNSHGQLGRNISTTSTADASGLGVWTPGEILFQNYGDMEQMTANDTPVNEIANTMYHSDWNNKHKFGRPVAIASNKYHSNNSCQVVLIDDLGQLYTAGDNGGYSMNPYAEFDNLVDRDAALHVSSAFHPVWSQPEPMTAIQWNITGSSTDNSWCTLGASGTVYVGGQAASHQLGLNSWTSDGGGAITESVGGFHPLAISA